MGAIPHARARLISVRQRRSSRRRRDGRARIQRSQTDPERDLKHPRSFASIRGYKFGSFSRLLHKYQLATEQYGCQHSAIRAISEGFGMVSSPYAFFTAFRTPRSPDGSTFGRRSANIKNI